MKPQDRYAVRAVPFGAVVICCAIALYLALDTIFLSETSPGGRGWRGYHRAQSGTVAEGVAIPVDRALLGSLPGDWQAEWRGGMLWITHYNPNGTVADCLPFNDLESYHNWVYAHPDFCDVNVEKLARRAP